MINKPKRTEKTPMENFTEAAKRIFNLPKSDVQKIKDKTPAPRKQRGKKCG